MNCLFHCGDHYIKKAEVGTTILRLLFCVLIIFWQGPLYQESFNRDYYTKIALQGPPHYDSFLVFSSLSDRDLFSGKAINSRYLWDLFFRKAVCPANSLVNTRYRFIKIVPRKKSKLRKKFNLRLDQAKGPDVTTSWVFEHDCDRSTHREITLEQSQLLLRRLDWVLPSQLTLLVCVYKMRLFT